MSDQEKKVLISVQLSTEEVIKNMAKAQAAMQKMRSENRELSKNYEENSEAISVNNIQIKNLQSSVATNQKIALANTATVEGSTGAYRKAELQLAVMNQKAKDLALTYGTMDIRTIEASKSAKELNDKLKEVDSNIGRNERSVGDYKNQIIAAVRELTDLKTVTSEMEVEQKRLEQTNQKGSVEYKLLSKEIENNQSQIAKLEGGSVSLSEKLDSVGGAGGQVIQTTKGMGTAFKALLANPILATFAAIVGIATLLWKSFTRNEESTNKLNRVTGMLSGIFNGLLSALEPVANFIVDKLIGAFEFGGKAIDKMLGLVSKGLKAVGLDSAAKGLDNLTNSVKKNADAGAKLADAEAKLQSSQREARKIQLENQMLAEKQRQIRDDESKSIEERARANERLGSILKKQANSELSIANQGVAVAKMRISINGRTKENLDELAAKETEVIDIKERITGQESEQLANLNGLRRDALAKQIANLNAEVVLLRNKQSKLIETKLIEQDYYDARVKTEKDAYEKSLQIIELEKKAKTISATEAKSKQIEAEKTKNDAILTLTDQRITQVISNNKYESDLTRLKNDEEIAAHKQTSKQIYLNSLMQIENDKKLAIQEQDLKLSADKNYQVEHDRQIALITQQNRTSIAQANKAFEESERQRSIEVKRNNLDNELAAVRNNIDLEFKLNAEKLDQERKQEIEAAQLTGESVELINAKYRQLEIDADAEKFQKKFEAIKQYADSMSGVLSGANELSKQIEAGQLQDAEDANTKKIADLDARLKKGSISQKEHDKQVAASATDLDKKKAKIARDQAIRDKELSLFSTIVNTAAAIVAMLKTGPAGIPLSIAAGITGALEIGTILATPLPKASRGILLKGKSHAAGGIPIEAEGGEAIINKKSTAMYGDLLSAINVAGGGIAFSSTPRFTNDGGYTARKSNESSGISKEDIQDAMERAVAKINVRIAIEDIRKADQNYTDVQARGTF